MQASGTWHRRSEYFAECFPVGSLKSHRDERSSGGKEFRPPRPVGNRRSQSVWEPGQVETRQVAPVASSARTVRRSKTSPPAFPRSCKRSHNLPALPPSRDILPAVPHTLAEGAVGSEDRRLFEQRPDRNRAYRASAALACSTSPHAHQKR